MNVIEPRKSVLLPKTVKILAELGENIKLCNRPLFPSNLMNNPKSEIPSMIPLWISPGETFSSCLRSVIVMCVSCKSLSPL